MSSAVMSIRLPDDVKSRLDALSASTGRPVSYYVREAVVDHLDLLEHAYALQADAEAARRGELKTHSLADVMAELGDD